MSSSAEPTHNPESAPDPDEDDLDELDDMLDEFKINEKAKQKTSPAPPTPAAAASSSNNNNTAAAAADDGEEPSMDDFAKHIQQSMADMVKELEQDPESLKQFEQLMKGFADPKEFDIGADDLSTEGKPDASAAPGSSKPTPKAADASAKGEPAFQDTIRRTLERMKQSSESADTAANKNPAEDDLMAALMKELASQGEGDGDGDDAFSKMLLGMMEQLTNKEILYEPMKDLNDKFDGWLAANASDGQISKEDLARYKEQRRLVAEIVGRFEKEGYSDSKAEDREYIVERMQQMQAQGAPPQELVGDMAGAEAMMGDMDGGCAPQ